MHLTLSTLTSLLDTWGYLAVFVFVAIESSGIPFPGETMLITASVYAGSGHLQIPFVIAAAAAGAIMGDNLGYLAGRKGGRPLVLRYGKYIRFDEAKLQRAEEFFARYGDKTVFFGRFIAVLRAWAAFLAGLNEMPWHKFFLYNAAGGICWATLYGFLAYEFGSAVIERVTRFVGIGGLVAVLAAILLLVIFRRRARALWERTAAPGQPEPTDPPAAEPQPTDLEGRPPAP